MSGRRGNLFAGLPVAAAAEEVFEALAAGPHVLVERIVSSGQATPPGAWLEQERDEWVVLLEGEAELSFADGSRLGLGRGDWVLIPRGVRHRVERTRAEPPCVWLAVHAELGGGS
ncbi:MAG TPA: cupin domain-containing protein [Gaiellaceae bacterium]|nr:cupin domain-containing protein [Gaiellaceae bacterium]